MREISFRGKQTGSEEWAEGCLIRTPKYCCILQDEEKVHPMDYPYLDNDTGCLDGYATPVIPETVGQYTGFNDKNSKKIFEGDICKHRSEYSGNFIISVVTYTDGCFLAMADNNSGFDLSENLEIIGNIHDNPELLKGGENQ